MEPEQDVKKFGRYVVSRLIGEGGMGQVYLGWDPVLDRSLAIKVISLDMHLPDEAREEYLSRFRLEAKASAKLNHQSIVAVYDAGDHEGLPWIGFEYVEGERLDQLLQRVKRIPLNTALTIAHDIASALQHAHSHGIIHRDIKPANILIDKSTKVAKLADFGIAKAPWAGLTQEGTTVGSPGYMAPEQIDGEQPDLRTDLFSLGIVLYQMLTGKHPFLRDTIESTAFATMSGACEPLSRFPEIPTDIQNLVRRCLEPKRRVRIASAEDILRVLDAHKSGGTKKRASLSPSSAVLFSKSTDNVRKVVHQAKQKLRGMYSGTTHRAESALEESFSQFVVRSRDSRIPGRDSLLAWLRGIGRQSRMRARAIRSWVRGLSRRDTGLLYAGASGLVLLVLLVVVSGSRQHRKLSATIRNGTLVESIAAARELGQSDVGRAVEVLFRRGEGLLASESIEMALMLAEKMIDFWPSVPHGHLLQGRASMRSGSYEHALEAFGKVKRLDGGRGLLRESRGPILGELGQELMRAAASPSLIRCATTVLSSKDEAVVRGWLESRSYWLRWNSVAIMKAGNKEIDMTPVYVLDLTSGENVSVRMNAVRHLASLNNPRAVSALKNTARDRDQDPMVVSAAKNALR